LEQKNKQTKTGFTDPLRSDADRGPLPKNIN